MNKDRRLFLNQFSIVAGIAALSKPIASAAAVSRRVNSLHASRNSVTIYNTNDLHGNIDPVVANMGGLNKIKALIRREETSGLLFDGGDFLNASQSLSHQKNMIYAMNGLGYHAVTPGNNELAAGQDHLAALAPLMRFTMVNCNYEFNNALCKFVKPYIIIHSGKFKVGVTGVGQPLKGIKYNDAIQSANSVAKHLKENEQCDLVVCLSHLGYDQAGDTPDAKKLAAQSENIDIIVSGHNRKALAGPSIRLNKHKQEVVVSQAAWNGLMMGKTTFGFDNKKQTHVKAKYLMAGNAAGNTFLPTFTKLRAMEKHAASV